MITKTRSRHRGHRRQLSRWPAYRSPTSRASCWIPPRGTGAISTAKKTDVGERRDVVQQPTRTLDELEMHITTLNPHTASHPPHTHPNEEMVIVREGTLQAHVNGKEIVVGAGGVLFYASMQPHAVQNIGDTPATYYVINWASPGTKTKKIPPTPAPSTAQ